MKRSGHRSWAPDVSQALAFEQHARAMPLPAPIGLLVWLRGFRRRPRRTFWQLDSTIGDRRRI